MKNKSTHHKEYNTFKFQLFSERLANIDVDIFHRVEHQYEAQTEEDQCYFYQEIDKWNVLNLTEGYDAFKKEMGAHRLITLAQLLLDKERVVEVLIKHLKYKNVLCLQPLLSITVSLAKDLRKDFYEYYPQFFEVLLELLNTKDTEQLEWTFTCLAYLFKILWSFLIKNIGDVFISLLPLLSDQKPDYIRNFAAESFAFVARKVRDKKAFLGLILKVVKNKNDGAEGCGKLFFEVIKGINGQFHSCAEKTLPFLVESLNDQKLPTQTLFCILEHLIASIVLNIKPDKTELLWVTFINQVQTSAEVWTKDQTTENKENLIMLLQLLGQGIEYKNGRMLQNPIQMVNCIVGLFNVANLPEDVLLILTKLGVLLLLSTNVRLAQENASSIIRKVLSLGSDNILLYFVENTTKFSSFEALILPSFLKYCVKNDLSAESLHVLTKIVLNKAPLAQNGINLPIWTKYNIDFGSIENNSKIRNKLCGFLENENWKTVNVNYFCALVLLPHLTLKETKNIQEQLYKNSISLIDSLKTENDQKKLFLLNLTMECLVHLDAKELVFDLYNNCLGLLDFYCNENAIFVLNMLDMILFVLKDDKRIINLAMLEKLDGYLKNNFSSPVHKIRLLTTHIYTLFENIPEFDLRHSTDPEVPKEKFAIFSLCHRVETIESHVQTYRDQLQCLEKLSYGKPQMIMCSETNFKTIPIRYLCGTLYINFQLLWEPTIKIIETHAHGLNIGEFWGVFGEELKNAWKNIQNVENLLEEKVNFGSDFDFIKSVFSDFVRSDDKPDFANYRLLLWRALNLFADVAEAKTRDVSELLLQFFETEYSKSNSDVALMWNIKQNSTDPISLEDLDETKEEEDNQTKQKKPKQRNKNSGGKNLKTLLQYLSVFAKIRSPKSMYREPDLYKLYFDLLQHKNPDIQKAALDCIMTYKFKYLIPYKDNLYNLIDDKNFKNELSVFKIDRESNVIQPEHRENLIPVVLRIVYSKMSAKTGLRTGGKASGQLRRTLVFRFLAGCEENEMLKFINMAFKFYNKHIDCADDAQVLVQNVASSVDLEKYIPPKRLQSTLNMINVVMEQFGSLMSNEVLTFLLKIILICAGYVKGAFAQQNSVHGGYLNALKTMRTSCIKLIVKFFDQFDRYPWDNQQINAVFDSIVWPYLDKLNTEGIHSPTALLQLFVQWGSNPRYFSLLVKHSTGNEAQFVLPHVINLLLNEKSHGSVQVTIMEMLEKLLNLQPDEEDLQLKLPVDNLRPVEQKILERVKLDDKLNYGSCILLPYVPQILTKIKRKLENKNKTLNLRELFILTRISELVWEPDLSDTILQLLLPIIHKKCQLQVGEDVILQYLQTVNNLIQNVTQPIKHIRQISPLFAEVHYASGRKVLIQILEKMAGNDAQMQDTCALVKELNAYDLKWVDQPDFQKRHDAFKIVQSITENSLDLTQGILIIYNCYFLIRTEKDLSLRENSSHCLKTICPLMVKKFTSHKDLDYVLNETVLTLIRNGMRSKNDDFRNECISLLGLLSRECAESHPVLRDLHPFTNKADPEVDFFENLTHLQLHRHARALQKFSVILKDLTVTPNPRTLTQFILPLASYYLCSEKYISKNSVVDAAIETIGAVCRVLPWHHYEGMLKYYLSRLRHKVEYQKQLVRLTVAILDAFHFDLSKAHVDLKGKKGKNEEKLVEEVKEVVDEVKNVEGGEKIVEGGEENVDEPQEEVGVEEALELLQEIEEEEEDIENSENELKVSDKITMLCKSTATRVTNTIQNVLLPQLHRALAEMTHHEGSHKVNRKKTGFEREEEDLLRVPISLAVVKLLQRLPVGILEHNLPGVFMKLCTFLKSQLESVRRVARETLQKIMLTIGPKYLGLLLAEISPLMSRGYQVHVLVFTIHGVLNCLKDMYQPEDIDRVLITLVNLCKADLFGVLSEEKEVSKISVKTSEAKSTKSYDMFQIISHYITEKCLMDLILPIKDILLTSHSFKMVQKSQECLRHIAMGLVDNTFVKTESLLVFAYGTASESIPQLLPVEKKPKISDKDKELLRRKNPDCFIIPKAPVGRLGIRVNNVKSSNKTNAHLLVEFGLRLCLVMLKRERLKEEVFKSFLDPFVAVFKNCLSSKHVKLCTITVQCLTWVLKYELPSMKDSIKEITKDMFGILHKYGAAGLNKGDNFDLVVATFKAMAVLVRDVKYHTIDTDQLKVLLLYAEQDLHDHDRQATAFSLLKAIISRKLVADEIHEIMKKVAELSITSELSYVRSQCRQVFHQFFMDYPLGNKLDGHIGFYQSQMSFEMQYGRESAYEMILMLINSFPKNILQLHSQSFLITLGARLINDEVPECRKMVADNITALINKLSKEEREPLFDMVELWFKDKNISHRRLAAQLCGFFVQVEKAHFEVRLKKITPLILKQFGFNTTPGQFVKLKKAKHETEEEERIKDHHYFQVLQLLLKICAHCPVFLTQKSVIDNFATNIQTLLSYPHDWVRLSSAQFLGYVLSSMDIDKLGNLLANNKSDDAGYLTSDPVTAVKTLTLDLCDQLQPGSIKSDLAEQVIKNLVFIARVLQKVPITSSETGSETKTINLLWLTKRMRKIVNTEVVETPTEATLRTEVFKWIAGVGTALDLDKVLPVLHHLLAPLVREMITTEESNAPLRQLAKEVGGLIKKRVGMETYTTALSKLQQTLSIRRAERKRSRTQLAVTDPEMFAKKKIKRHEKKKESKKRKIADRKGTKKVFKKRKVVDLDSSEIM